jgi:hypothetical protein
LGYNSLLKGKKMSEYVPDRWVVLKLTSKVEGGATHYRIFATWSGGYLTGNSWKLNSGIVQAQVDRSNTWSFTGDTGSVYRCRAGGYGLSGYGAGVLQSLTDNNKDYLTITVLDQLENWNELNYT